MHRGRDQANRGSHGTVRACNRQRPRPCARPDDSNGNHSRDDGSDDDADNDSNDRCQCQRCRAQRCTKPVRVCVEVDEDDDRRILVGPGYVIDLGPAGAPTLAGALAAAGLAGLPGAAGAAGIAGVAGIAGIPGVAGVAGVAGAIGLRGPMGLQGVAGATGPLGPAGPAGPAGATGPAGPAGPPGPGSGSLIPFASGIIVPASVTSASDVVIGFGANRVLANSAIGNLVQSGQYAFSVPRAGFVTSLQASADIHAVPNTAQAALTYTFTLERSTAVNTAGFQITDPYTEPLLVANVTFPTIGGAQFPVGAYLSNTASSAAVLVPVALGDRLVLRVTSNLAATPEAVDELALNAGLIYIGS